MASWPDLKRAGPHITRAGRELLNQAVLIERDLQRGQMTSTHWSPGRGLWQQARSYP